jgi:hypothetical protein
LHHLLHKLFCWHTPLEKRENRKWALWSLWLFHFSFSKIVKKTKKKKKKEKNVSIFFEVPLWFFNHLSTRPFEIILSPEIYFYLFFLFFKNKKKARQIYGKEKKSLTFWSSFSFVSKFF